MTRAGVPSTRNATGSSTTPSGGVRKLVRQASPVGTSRCLRVALTSSWEAIWGIAVSCSSDRLILAYVMLARSLAAAVLQRSAREFAAQHDKRPRRQLRVGAEAEMAGGGARVAEHALQRHMVVNAACAGPFVQRAHGLDTQLDRQRAIALVAQPRLGVRSAPFVVD